MSGSERPVNARQLRALHKRLVKAAREVDDAWDAWMTDEEGEGQERVERSIAGLRESLAWIDRPEIGGEHS